MKLTLVVPLSVVWSWSMGEEGGYAAWEARCVGAWKG